MSLRKYYIILYVAQSFRLILYILLQSVFILINSHNFVPCYYSYCVHFSRQQKCIIIFYYHIKGMLQCYKTILNITHVRLGVGIYRLC